MPHRPEFELVFAPEVIDHLEAIEARYHRLIERTLDEQLRHTPVRETRNRKPLAQPAPFAATWELRFGPGNRFRALYEVDELTNTVLILAVGVKEGSRLVIGGEEVI